MFFPKEFIDDLRAIVFAYYGNVCTQCDQRRDFMYFISSFHDRDARLFKRCSWCRNRAIIQHQDFFADTYGVWQPRLPYLRRVPVNEEFKTNIEFVVDTWKNIQRFGSIHPLPAWRSLCGTRTRPRCITCVHTCGRHPYSEDGITIDWNVIVQDIARAIIRKKLIQGQVGHVMCGENCIWTHVWREFTRQCFVGTCMYLDNKIDFHV